MAPLHSTDTDKLWRLVSGSLLSLGCNVFYSHWFHASMEIVRKVLYVLRWGLVLPTGAGMGLFPPGVRKHEGLSMYDFVIPGLIQVHCSTVNQ